MRCNGKAGKVRCVVPMQDGKHVDGNPDHYNGPSHWTNNGWMRG